MAPAPAALGRFDRSSPALTQISLNEANELKNNYRRDCRPTNWHNNPPVNSELGASIYFADYIAGEERQA